MISYMSGALRQLLHKGFGHPHLSVSQEDLRTNHTGSQGQLHAKLTKGHFPQRLVSGMVVYT